MSAVERSATHLTGTVGDRPARASRRAVGRDLAALLARLELRPAPTANAQVLHALEAGGTRVAITTFLGDARACGRRGSGGAPRWRWRRIVRRRRRRRRGRRRRRFVRRRCRRRISRHRWRRWWRRRLRRTADQHDCDERDAFHRSVLPRPYGFAARSSSNFCAIARSKSSFGSFDAATYSRSAFAFAFCLSRR